MNISPANPNSAFKLTSTLSNQNSSGTTAKFSKPAFLSVKEESITIDKENQSRVANCKNSNTFQTY